MASIDPLKTHQFVRDRTWFLEDQRVYFNHDPTNRLSLYARRLLKGLNENERMAIQRLPGGRSFQDLKRIGEDLAQFLNLNADLLTRNEQRLIRDLRENFRNAEWVEINLKTIRLSFLPAQGIEYLTQLVIEENKKRIDELQIGDSVAISGQTKTDTGSHGIFYTIERSGENDYLLSVFNTGKAANFFFPFTFDEKGRIAATMPIFNAKKNHLLDSSFLKSLYFFEDEKIDPLFETFRQKFGNPMPGIKCPIQTWGTCSFDSPDAYLQAKMPKHLLLAFEYQSMLRARKDLVDFLPEARKTAPDELLRFIDQKSTQCIQAHADRCREYLANHPAPLLKRLFPTQTNPNNYLETALTTAACAAFLGLLHLYGG